jgi:hypothetical protein
MEMMGKMQAVATIALTLGGLAGVALAQEAPATPPPAANAPAPSAAAPNSPAPSAPTKAPKPKSRLKLLQQMQIDFDMAATRAKVDEKGRKKLDKCHEVLIDAIAQQQRYKSVNVGKVNGCLNDLDKLDDAGAFAAEDRDKLRVDREKVGESVGKTHHIHLPQPL